jgi:hypothetical protein
VNNRHFAIACAIVLVISGVTEAAAQITAPAPAPVKAPAHGAKAKAKAPAAGMETVKFSDPSAPLGEPTKSPNAPPPSAARPVAKIPEGGPSLDVKWHADNSHINDRYWEPWVPNGQGANVEARVKLGF